MTKEKQDQEFTAELKEFLKLVTKLSPTMRIKLADEIKSEWLPQMTGQGRKELVSNLETFVRSAN